MKKKSDFWYYRVTGYALFAFFLSVSFSSFAQEESEPAQIKYFEDSPLYLSAGVQYGRYYGPEFGRSFPYTTTTEFGFLFQYALFQQLPFISGLEWQWRGYDINSEKSGKNQSGFAFTQTAKGRVNLHYFTIPFLFVIPANNEKKLHFVLGMNTSLRFLYKDNYCAEYKVPEIGFAFDSCYSKFRNDAMDYFDFHGVCGLRYRVHPRLSFLLSAAYKLGGLSTSKENFITRRELNNHFSLKVMWTIGSIAELPFF